MKRYVESVRIAQLLAKYATNELSEIEKSELESLIKESGIGAESIEQIIKNRGLYITDKEADTEVEKRVWSSVEKRINQPRKNFAGHFLRYAAIFILIASIPLSVYLFKNTQQTHGETLPLISGDAVLEYQSGESVILDQETDIKSIIKPVKIETGKDSEILVAEILKVKVSSGKTHIIRLEDGTTVTLYPGSELVFPSFFSKEERDVKLTGEAYFDVEKDPARPFHVTAGDAKISVLGTSFNVRAYESETNIETALVTGKVLINDMELSPNQMAVFNKESKEVKIENTDTGFYLERANGMFVFENRTLDEIMKEFSLWFGFSYDFKEMPMKEKKFRFKLPRSNNFGRLMDLMEKTGEIEFEVTENSVTILPGKK
ncbi:MAG: FecR family protein [Bacteroidales bacterium]